ncbi:MAG TPA: autotransporter-associated beta strand repeat-containing protein, partial [Cytophagaceae bacterium]|nr:autotransporter-associated beta strand repeat-containing protein [Cytophagaceae bacterium]
MIPSIMTMRYPITNPCTYLKYVVIIVLFFFFSSEVFAATSTWKGGTGTNWTTANNWVGNVAPSAGDDLVFTTNNTTSNNDYAANTSFASITFLNAAGNNFTVTGNAIILTTFINNQKTSSTMTVSLNINFGAGVATITVAGGGTLLLSGSLTGTGGVTKAGTGTLSLGNPAVNQWTGPTIVTAGTMIGGTQNGGDIYQTSSLTVNAGATFNQPTLNANNNNFQNSMILSVDGSFNMNGSQDLIGYIAGGGTISNVGQVGQMGFWFSMPGTGSGSNFSGVMSGTGFMKFSGVGTTQILSGLNTYTGQTIIQSGTVSINTINNTGSASSLGAPTTVANGTIAMGNTTSAATLLYTGTGSSTNRVVDLAGTT